MLEDEPFLRAMLANPDDHLTRLVYADWLDEHADPRAEFLRLEVRLAETLPDDPAWLNLRQRKQAMQASLPSWWLATIGGLRATSKDERRMSESVNEMAEKLGRQAKYFTTFGYEVTLSAAALCRRTDAMAYLESYSKSGETYDDINYTLHIRHPDGRATSWEPETYNPFFGCRVRFLEWYDNAVIFIYREKHRTYLARIGFDSRPDFREIADDWILDGRQLAYLGWRSPQVRRLSIPQLEELPPLSLTAAAEAELLPRTA